MVKKKKPTREEIVNSIKKMTVLELLEFVKILQEELRLKGDSNAKAKPSWRIRCSVVL